MTIPKYINSEQQIKVTGKDLSIGHGFTGVGFRHAQFKGAMDPIIMVDHYTMTSSTFGVHPHAGISAVSVIFEDTVGKFHNRDSLGNNFDIEAGDLYWLNAGSGALHDESPREGAKVHGLQIFVNLPAKLKHGTPSSLLIRKQNMPIIEGQGHRVRLVLGKSNNQKVSVDPVWPFTILDGYISDDSNFAHHIAKGFNAWLYAVDGSIEYKSNGRWHMLAQGESTTISQVGVFDLKIRGTSQTRSHFTLLSGQIINESFVQQGPFAMSSQQEIEDIITRYQAGELGSLQD
ncbi:nuclease PIN [Vibrio nigripulchritudo]|uniref:pirin family protein n=1 Tax=Vibrio nigripulchritudo TaxID=28173 RepID=UPI00190DA790|nr:pirin family protein [Vibrio nigripulchritudo]BCL69038.1 nuclease PIN [Vibrio nigripulchritudo]BDU30369.1 nuclease PIN [Vibrio nigripulchritudo]